MHSLPSFSQTARPLRIASLLLAAVLCIVTPLHTASASDALTTVASALTSRGTTSTRTSLLKSLFGSKSSSSSSSTSTSSSSQLSRSILGLPIGILKTALSAISKSASSTVTEHIKKN